MALAWSRPYGRWMTSRQFLILLFLGAMFGASFLYMRIAAPALGPWDGP